MDNNKVLVEVPYPYDNSGMMEIEISDNIMPDWLSLDNPTISNVIHENETLTFETDLPCYSTLFKKTDAKNISLVSRQIDTLKTKHSIDIADITGISIGVITELGKTSLIDL